MRVKTAIKSDKWTDIIESKKLDSIFYCYIILDDIKSTLFDKFPSSVRGPNVI